VRESIVIVSPSCGLYFYVGIADRSVPAYDAPCIFVTLGDGGFDVFSASALTTGRIGRLRVDHGCPSSTLQLSRSSKLGRETLGPSPCIRPLTH